MKRESMAQAEEVKVPIFSNYEPLPGAHDELFAARAEPWPTIAPIIAGLEGLGAARMERRQRLADNTFLKGGVTFSVYSDNRGGERIFPFDLIPRVVTAEDWEQVERGLLQRVNALNHFLADVYGDARILKEKVVPAELVHGGTGYLKEVHGIRPRATSTCRSPASTWCATVRGASWCSRTTYAVPLASPTCSPTATC